MKLIWPPWYCGFRLQPERDLAPLLPRPEVLPMPLDSPRPRRLRGFFLPTFSVISWIIMMTRTPDLLEIPGSFESGKSSCEQRFRRLQEPPRPRPQGLPLRDRADLDARRRDRGHPRHGLRGHRGR